MNRSKKIAFGLLGFIGIILIVLLVGGFFVEQKIRDGINEELGEKLTWEELDVDIFRRSISLDKATLSVGSSSIEADAILLKDLNFFKYLFGNEIRVGNLEIRQPEIIFREEQQDDEEPSGDQSTMEQEISIGSLRIVNGTVRIPGAAEARDKLSLEVGELVLEGIKLDSASVKKKIPFEYDSYELSLQALQFDLDGLHDLLVNRLSAEEGNLLLERVEIVSRYDKVEFQKHIPYEKDRFELQMETLELTGLEWSFVNDSLLLQSSGFVLNNADLEVYRNKLMPEDPHKKTLYSEKLRNLPVKLDFPDVELRSSRITYEEKTLEGRPPGRVFFTEVGAEIQNLTNLGMGNDDFPATVIHAEALFHGESPVVLDWEFDVSNTREEFIVSGRLADVTAEGINAFVKPTLNVESRGGIDSFAFNFAGNDDNAIGDVETRYENFKINILKDDGTEKRSFWSAVANLFISNDAVTDNVEHSDLSVTRDKTKSFWNFLWLCIREGALSSLL